MSVVTEVERWGNSHRPGFLDIFRIALGVFITYKGLDFATHINELQTTTAGMNLWFAGAFLAHYVIFAHVLAGPLILIGLFTRIACMIQVPILLGAAFLVNDPEVPLSLGRHMELKASLLVLLGLVVFIVFGAGKFSIDAIRRRDLEATH